MHTISPAGQYNVWQLLVLCTYIEKFWYFVNVEPFVSFVRSNRVFLYMQHIKTDFNIVVRRWDNNLFVNDLFFPDVNDVVVVGFYGCKIVYKNDFANLSE